MPSFFETDRYAAAIASIKLDSAGVTDTLHREAPVSAKSSTANENDNGITESETDLRVWPIVLEALGLKKKMKQ